MANHITRITLGWDRPWIESTVEQLAKSAANTFPADFSPYWIIVPTAEAGRLLREQLAARFSDRGGITSLRVDLPDALLRTEIPTATQAEVMAAWVNTLQRPQLSCDNIFKNRILAKNRRNYAFLLGIAQGLQTCREELAAEGKSLAEVYRQLDRCCRDQSGRATEDDFCRFQELYHLEQLYLENFPSDVVEPVMNQLAAIRRPALPSGVEKIIFAGCPDLRNGPLKAVEHLAVDLEIWIGAPSSELAHFDRWGRPEPVYWEKAPIPLPVPERIRRFANTNDQAAKIFELLDHPRFRPGVIGVLDEEIAVALLEKIQQAPPGGHLKVYVPQKRTLNSLPWSRLLLDLLQLAEQEIPFELVSRLSRNGLIQEYCLASGLVPGFRNLLKQLDQLQYEHLLTGFDAMDDLMKSRFPREESTQSLAAFLTCLRQWRQRLENAGHILREGFSILGEIGQTNSLKNIDFQLSSDELAALRIQVSQAIAAKPYHPAYATALLQCLLKHTEIQVNVDSEAAIDLVGFLELPWRSDRTLLISGFNEENFDYGKLNDNFLPEQARELLNMTTARHRYAADAFRFRALAASRELYILYGKGSAEGDVLRPSRLLLHCPSEALPERTEQLFSGQLDEDIKPPILLQGEGGFPPYHPWHGARLNNHMSITAFRNYLECPFKFYREKILRMQELTDRNIELDALQFGNLIHEVMRRFGLANQAMPFRDTAALERFCLDELQNLEHQRFHHSRAGIAGVQLELMEQNLHYFADVQMRENLEGWQTAAVEYPATFQWERLYREIFPKAPAESWREAITVKGTLDRLDCRPRPDGNGNQWRVIDYKTNRAGVKPQEKHLTTAAGQLTEEEKNYRLAFVKEGKRAVPCYWTDLQLPLYLLIVRHILNTEFPVQPDDPIQAAYFNLPLAFTDTRLEYFHELENPAVLESAVRCADQVLKLIFVEAVFWPPKIKHDLFDSFHQTIGTTTIQDYIPPERGCQEETPQ